MKIIESFTGFQPLEEAWIGGTYPTSFYKHLPNEIEDTFCRISEQTQTGFDKLEKVLKGLGVTVHKPKFTDNIEDYHDSFGNLIKPPIAPRDWILTLGNELLITPQGYCKEPYQHVIDLYIKNNENVTILDRSKDPRAWIVFPGVVRVGKRLIVDTAINAINDSLETVKQAMARYETEYEIFYTNAGGHLDGVFCPIKAKHIFASHWAEKTLYDKTFPDWQVFWIQTEKKNKRNGRWWTAENNFYSPIFSKHIEEKAADWVGNSKETVFEANMLVVDEINVICIAEHQPSFKKMRELGIEPHVVDFPTRHFWDGAIHCITVDIRRSGGCLDYFNA